MSTLTGFTRPSDPINAVDLQNAIATAIGKTVDSLVVTATDIQVTGSTIVSGDQSVTQAAIAAYFYAYLQYGAPISDNPAMSGTQHGRGVTEAVAYAGDLATYNSTRRKAYVSGVLKQDSFIYASKAVTVSGGGITFYITSDGTSGGVAVFNNVYADSIAINVYGSAGNYQAYSPTVSGDKKSITATISQLTSVIGILTFNSSAASGIDCRLYVMGD